MKLVDKMCSPSVVLKEGFFIYVLGLCDAKRVNIRGEKELYGETWFPRR